MTLTLRTAPEAVLIKGAVGTGKTSALVAMAAEKIAAGAAPDSLLVFASTPDAAAQLASRLEAAGMKGVRASPHRALSAWRCFPLLRPARPLVRRSALGKLVRASVHHGGYEGIRFEENQALARNAQVFFYRGWTELSGEDPEWLVTSEEETVHGMLKASLGFTRSILEPELAALAWSYLSSHEDALSAVAVDQRDCGRLPAAFPRIAVRDEYGCARLLVAVAADPLACIEVYDSYPYGDGVAELEEAGAQVIQLEECHLCGASLHAAKVLRAAELGDADVALGNPNGLDAALELRRDSL